MSDENSKEKPEEADSQERTESTEGTEEPESTEKSSKPVTAVELIYSLRWPVAVIVLAYVGYLMTDRSCQSADNHSQAPVEVIEQAEKMATSIAERFHSGRITKTFNAAIPRLLTGEGLKLEVAAFESTETFRQTNERRVMFDLIDLGTNETEIQVPVTYRYHIKLNDSWQIDVDDQKCIVKSPAILPTLPAAIHTDGMKKKSSRGWARFDVDDQMEALEKSITPTLDKRASSEESLGFVRERARQQVAEFIRGWLMQEDHWRDDRFRSIIVVFPDENLSDSELNQPTLVLEDQVEAAVSDAL